MSINGHGTQLLQRVSTITAQCAKGVIDTSGAVPTLRLGIVKLADTLMKCDVLRC
jgi:hypothetical protein